MSSKKETNLSAEKGSLFVDEMPEIRKSYPSVPDSDGFYFEDEQDEAQEIYTKEYENGAHVKKVILKNKKVAIIRELNGREIIEAQSRGKKVREKSTEGPIMVANIAAAATKVDNEQIIIEELIEMRGSDYTKIVNASAALNLL